MELDAFFKEAVMDLPVLNEVQKAEAERIEALLLERMGSEAKLMAALLVSKPNGELFGQTEFQIREGCHRIGACALDAALEERKKRGTKVRV
jgi:hypothetical protein